MTPVTDRSFGLLIAYVIPGFATLWIWGEPSSTNGLCETATDGAPPSVGGFLYVTVASVAIGMFLSTVRWAVIDRIHHLTGLKPPRWRPGTGDFPLDAYQLVIDQHYRYYQFYGSSLLLAAGCLIAPPASGVGGMLASSTGRLALIALTALFFAASRDTLERCYRTTDKQTPSNGAILTSRENAMTNGGPHDSIGGSTDAASATSHTPDSNGEANSAPNDQNSQKSGDESGKQKSPETR